MNDLIVRPSGDQASPLLVNTTSAVMCLSEQEIKTLIHERFAVLGDIGVSRYGIVGMVLLDSHPRQRCGSYVNGHVQGMEWKVDSDFEYSIPPLSDGPVRQAHFLNTEKGCSLIRWFVHPDSVRRYFESNRFLGTPMVHQSQCHDSLIPENFDEVQCNEGWQPCSDGLSLVETLATSLGRMHPGLVPNWETHVRPAHWPYISFHSWLAFQDAAAVACSSIVPALETLDEILDRASTKGRPNDVQVRAADALPPSAFLE